MTVFNMITNSSVRDKIYKAAIELFARKGFSGTTIRHIVQKANVTQPMVYYYFGNKQQLFVTCVRELYDQLTQIYQQIDSNQKFDKFLQEMLNKGKEEFADFPEALLLITKLMCSPDEFPRLPDTMRIVAEPFNMLVKAVDYAKKRGELRDNVSPWAFSIMTLGTLGFIATIHYIRNRYGELNDINLDISLDDLVQLFSFGAIKQ